MEATKAQKEKPMAVYGKQTARGNKGEAKAAALLRAEGYRVTKTPTHPHGPADLIATKGKTKRYIQVKAITSRTFATKQAAINRMAGRPFNVTLPAGYELWIFDQKGNLYKIRK